MAAYQIIRPTGNVVPVVVSVPHCGTSFPEELKDQFAGHHTISPDDTDFFVDRLYGFVPAMGITLIRAVYSRYVIDLNRDPQSKPLYTDGRIITGLCPTTTFLGEPLYRDKRQHVAAEDVEMRLQQYYWPYHLQLQQLLAEIKEEYGEVLLWDCHSIRQQVPTIQPEKFPDLILGDADGSSAGSKFIHVALDQLSSSRYSLQHNHPFKGGYITRQYGRPADKQHALQLEMTKVNYMNDTETEYDHARAARMQLLLKNVFDSLINELL